MLEQRRPLARIHSFARRHEPEHYTDPNCPTSPRYSERHRQKVTEIAPGMLRIDIGCEGI